MKSLRLNIVVLTVVLCSALFACSRNAGNTNTATNDNSGNSTAAASTPRESAEKVAYPQAVADEFLKSCETAGSDLNFCKCIFDKIQDKYSFEEFSVIESKISAGTPPDEFVEFTGRARAQCTR